MLLCIHIVIVILLGAVVNRSESTLTTVVETTSGPVRGEILITARRSLQYASFKGIPYAEPPIGYRRFKPPVENKPRTDVLNATKQSSVCPQYVLENSTVIGDEDCLYINVFTPRISFANGIQKNLKRVMVWIYGGAFVTGSSNTDQFGPDYLIEDDVIVVSFNYRLGALGFLNIDHENATGNAGLKDQNLALKWVKKNIAKFGGDANDVTIFGQSAGAVSVDLHVLSEMSSGLFAKSISMSGSPLCLYWASQSSAAAKLNAFSLGSKLGVATTNKDELLQGLYKATAVDIIRKSQELSFMPFRPTIEKADPAENQTKFLSECSVKKYLSGNYNKGPHMMGFTSNEMKSISQINLLKIIKSTLEFIKNATLLIDVPVLKDVAYFGVEELSQLSADTLKELIKVASDLFFVTGIDSKQKLMNAHNKHPIYYYRFSYDAGHQRNGLNIPGVGHAEDLAYIFHSNSSNDLLEEPDSRNVIDSYVRLFTNFAKYGNPTPSGQYDTALQNIIWSPSGTLGLHLEIDKRLSVGFRPIGSNVVTNELAGLGSSSILNNCF